jgi:tRNA pseudouridine55 synthase
LLDGVLVVDKPKGITSHDSVDRARRLLAQKRVGHAGTLDPIATGVLVLLLGKATRMSRFLTPGRKSYQGTVRLGFATDTDDADGRPVCDPRPVRFADEDLRRAAAQLTGKTQQLPPVYSAKKTHGEPAYRLVRRDEPVPRRPVDVEVYRLSLERVAEDRIHFDLECAAGTYVRALARDLGEILGCGGHLEGLVRTAVGPFLLPEAVTLEEAAGRAEVVARVVPFDGIPLPWPDVTISEEEIEKIRHGTAVSVAGRIATQGGARPEWVRLRSPQGAFLAMASWEGPFLHPRVVFLGE